MPKTMHVRHCGNIHLAQCTLAIVNITMSGNLTEVASPFCKHWQARSIDTMLLEHAVSMLMLGPNKP